MTINVRLAQVEDLEKCLQFAHIEDRDYMEAKIRFAEVMIAENDGQMVGCLRLEFLWNHVPFIGFIEVVEFFRHQGISRRLLDFVENSLRNRGKKILLSSSKSNEPEAQNWHRTLGFKEAGFIAGLSGEHNDTGELFFTKSLTAR